MQAKSLNSYHKNMDAKNGFHVMHTYNINSQYCAPLIQLDWSGPVGLARGATKKNKYDAYQYKY